MAIVRALDPATGDWTFGKSKSNYIADKAYTSQMIQTNVLMFLGDCFFDLGNGIDWFTYMGGSKDSLSLRLAISAQILNSPNVTGILQVQTSLNDNTRGFTVTYQATTTYSVFTNSFQYNLTG